MANNRMFLVNRRTGASVAIASYSPSLGWYADERTADSMNACFKASDFGHLSAEQLHSVAANPFGGPPYANYEPHMIALGDEWELRYENVSGDAGEGGGRG